MVNALGLFDNTLIFTKGELQVPEVMIYMHYLAITIKMMSENQIGVKVKLVDTNCKEKKLHWMKQIMLTPTYSI